ncbi:uncharacterized protein F4812DRAFT_456069 [Daldinia caldariorum]|uniref:uncharacterized protein n=1 Tax=Daldinia caldariorum TaxID=326644 RepID=UPI002007CB5C|nr:uncharacterized protein F4812DRAFT_456069 [Daldinia caldariorum]KAI1471966.1 hypothetical protein F4812DRAFT_456069 [Daldinia caldariorum]
MVGKRPQSSPGDGEDDRRKRIRGLQSKFSSDQTVRNTNVSINTQFQIHKLGKRRTYGWIDPMTGGVIPQVNKPEASTTNTPPTPSTSSSSAPAASASASMPAPAPAPEVAVAVGETSYHQINRQYARRNGQLASPTLTDAGFAEWTGEGSVAGAGAARRVSDGGMAQAEKAPAQDDDDADAELAAMESALDKETGAGADGNAGTPEGFFAEEMAAMGHAAARDEDSDDILAMMEAELDKDDSADKQQAESHGVGAGAAVADAKKPAATKAKAKGRKSSTKSKTNANANGEDTGLLTPPKAAGTKPKKPAKDKTKKKPNPKPAVRQQQEAPQEDPAVAQAHEQADLFGAMGFVYQFADTWLTSGSSHSH